MNKIFLEILSDRGLKLSDLNPDYNKLSSPYDLPNLSQAVDRIIQAINNNEHVIIFGDYDADGITSAALMKEALSLAGLKKIAVMLPDRFEDGYGMNNKILEKAKEVEATLIITVDCGTNNKEIITKIKNEGIDVVVTDHHEPIEELPNTTIVNPKLKNTNIPEGVKGLSGVGVAFYLVRGLVDKGMIAKGQEKWLLDLVAIGMLADNMTMTGENWILVKYGLLVLSRTKRPGLIELKKRAKVDKINTTSVTYRIAPRLNAAGRMGDAKLAFDLLITKSKIEANSKSIKLEKLNSDRQLAQKRAINEATLLINESLPVIIVSGKWHEGIVGIVAGRLMEVYKKPAIVLTDIGQGKLKGSGRSFGNFNLAEMIGECKNILSSGGGHALACGLSIEKMKLDNFIKLVLEYYNKLNLSKAEELKLLDTREKYIIEDFKQANLDLAENLFKLEPFGDGNEEPYFKLTGSVENKIMMGSYKNHLKIELVNDNNNIEVVKFYIKDNDTENYIRVGDKLMIIASIGINDYNGIRRVQFIANEIKIIN